MPKKCCVLNCKTGYDSQKDDIKVSRFRLPSVKTDAEERLKWIDVLNTVNGSWKVSEDTMQWYVKDIGLKAIVFAEGKNMKDLLSLHQYLPVAFLFIVQVNL